jgi:hypothetical protein
MQYEAHNESTKLPGFTGYMSLYDCDCYAEATQSVNRSMIIPSILSGASCASFCNRCLNGINLLPEGAPLPRGVTSKCNLCSSCGGGMEVASAMADPDPLCGYQCTFDAQSGLVCDRRCPGDF